MSSTGFSLCPALIIGLKAQTHPVGAQHAAPKPARSKPNAQPAKEGAAFLDAQPHPQTPPFKMRHVQILLNALERRFELLLSVPLILEYEAVLNRPEHLSSSGLTSDEVGRLLDDLAAVAKPVRLAFRWRPRLRDPNDDMVLETAVNGNAGAIVTFNQRDFEQAKKSFGCAVLLPAVAVQQIWRSP